MAALDIIQGYRLKSNNKKKPKQQLKANARITPFP